MLKIQTWEEWRSVSGVAYKQLISQRGFFFFFFFFCRSFFFIGLKVQGWQNVQSLQDQRRALCFSEWWGWDWIQRVSLCQAASRLSFRLYPPSCLSLSFPLLFLPFAVAPLNVYSISLYLLPTSVFMFTRSLYPSLFLQRSSVSVFLSRCRASPYRTSSHPSIHLSPLPPHCHYPSTFIIYALFYLLPSLPPSPPLHPRFFLSPFSFISCGGPRGWWLF